MKGKKMVKRESDGNGGMVWRIKNKLTEKLIIGGIVFLLLSLASQISLNTAARLKGNRWTSEQDDVRHGKVLTEIKTNRSDIIKLTKVMLTNQELKNYLGEKIDRSTDVLSIRITSLEKDLQDHIVWGEKKYSEQIDRLNKLENP